MRQASRARAVGRPETSANRSYSAAAAREGLSQRGRSVRSTFPFVRSRPSATPRGTHACHMPKLSILGFAILCVGVGCSSSTTSGQDAGGGGNQDGGTGSPDSGGTGQDSSGGNPCGTPGGTFACGAQSCRIDDQYCVGNSLCLDFDGCPSCSNPSIHCGIGKTPSCSGSPNTGIKVMCN